MATQRNGALGHLLALGASTGLVVIHASACVCVCAHVFVQASVHLHRLSGLAQWAGVELRGSPPGQLSVRPCQGQPPARGRWGRGRGGWCFSMTTRHAVSASNCIVLAHIHTPRMNFNTNTETKNKSCQGHTDKEEADCGNGYAKGFYSENKTKQQASWGGNRLD